MKTKLKLLRLVKDMSLVFSNLITYDVERFELLTSCYKNKQKTSCYKNKQKI